MTTVAVSMVRDEQDVIGHTVSSMLEEADYVIVADNLSTDSTREILDGIAASNDRLLVVDDHEPGYFQSQKMTALSARARLEFGADWIVPFDADELWSSPRGRIADVLADHGHAWVTPAHLYNHIATGRDPLPEDEPSPIHRMSWRLDHAAPLPKVACRWAEDLVIAQGNHQAHYGNEAPSVSGVLSVRHFPMRSVDQLIRKIRNGAAAYKAGGSLIPEYQGTHWRQWGEMLDTHGFEAIEALYRTYWYRENPDEVTVIDGEPHAPLVFDPARRTW